MVIGAYVYVPLPWTPVPITLQTFFVLLSGIILKRYAGLSHIIYIILGIGGLPVFTQAGAGMARLFGPTGGYLIGFVVAAMLVGLFYPVRKSPVSISGEGSAFRKTGHIRRIFSDGMNTKEYFGGLVVLMVGNMAIYVLGSIQLWLFLRTSPIKIFIMGVAPFVAGDLIKLFLAHQIGRWVRIKRWFDISF